ncbi:MAG: 3-keto-5-aminohexanoate cleavage protein [Syntrophales bacterium]
MACPMLLVRSNHKGKMAKSNAEQVSKIIRIIRELGSDPATPDEARHILGLKGVAKVNF